MIGDIGLAMYRIALDAMGGDNAPQGHRRWRKTGGRGIPGCHLAALWPRGRVKAACERRRASGGRPCPGRHRHARFADAGHATKDESSMVKAIMAVREGRADAVVFRRFHGRAPGWRHAAHRPHPRRRAPGAGSGDSRAQKALSAHRLAARTSIVRRGICNSSASWVRSTCRACWASSAPKSALPTSARRRKRATNSPRGLRINVQTDGVCV